MGKINVTKIFGIGPEFIEPIRVPRESVGTHCRLNIPQIYREAVINSYQLIRHTTLKHMANSKQIWCT